MSTLLLSRCSVWLHGNEVGMIKGQLRWWSDSKAAKPPVGIFMYHEGIYITTRNIYI